MNAPLELRPQEIPTTERQAFKDALLVAKSMGKPTKQKVKLWAELMKKALR